MIYLSEFETAFNALSFYINPGFVQSQIYQQRQTLEVKGDQLILYFWVEILDHRYWLFFLKLLLRILDVILKLFLYSLRIFTFIFNEKI